MTTSGISSPFELLSQTLGQVTNALLTRSPLRRIATSSFDLHVLGTPPAFILSQDQTLRKKFHSFEWILRKFTGLTEVVASYHFSVVKVLFLRRAGFYSRHIYLSRVLTDEIADALRIGSSDCKPFDKLRASPACVSDARLLLSCQ
jgi:hypothetical protein